MATPAPSLPGYNQITLIGLANALAQRLGDPNFVYWPGAELLNHITEALRVFQALTGWYRETGVLDVTSYGLMGPYFDLSNGTYFPNGSSSFPITTGLLTYNVTDQDVLTEIAAALLEAPINYATGLWQGTEQFDAVQFYTALQNRIWRFLGDTGVYLKWINQNLGAGFPLYSSRLYNYTLDVRRANWVDADGVRRIMNRVDAWDVRSYATSSFSPTPYPKYYSFDPNTQPSINWYPPANDIGTFELLYVPSGPTVGGATPVPLVGCPDDYCWAIKYGAMADLLGQDAEVRDPDRAAYCEQRYQMGVELAKTAVAVQMVYQNGAPLPIISSFEADHHARSWVNQSAGTPRYAIVEGRCIIAFDKVPTSNVAVDVIRNMPVPVSGEDQHVQCPNDALDSILDYSQHVASFKMGGYEFNATTRMFANFMMKAAQYNERIRQYSFYKDALRQAGITSLGELPRLEIPELSSIGTAGVGGR